LNNTNIGNSYNQSTIISNVILTASCQSEIVRAVGFVMSRYMCTLTPPKDCSSETTTKPNGEAVSYLTLKPYLYPGSFTSQGNSFGGQGWFDSSVLY
jgi:hypothetical protein